MLKKGIVFDLDGTLWDSTENIVPAWNIVFRRHREIKFEITLAAMRNLMGKMIPDIAAEVFPMFSTQHGLDIIDECSQEEIRYLSEQGGVLYPGLQKTLDALREEYALYIVSNCQAGYIEAFLKFYKFTGYFNDMECSGQTAKPKGENIRLLIRRNNLTHAVYVGDTESDRDAAKAAGIPFILAEYGFGRVHGSPYAIGRISDLPSMVGSVFKSL